MSKPNTPTPEPNPEPTPAPAPTPEPTPDPTPAPAFTQADLDAALKKAQKDWEKKIKDAEDKAKLSEDERLKAERDDALSQLRERDTRDTVQDEAKKAGVVNPKTFYAAYKSELEFDAKGKIANLKDVLDAARSQSPELFASPAPQGSADGGEGKGAPMAGLYSKEQLNKMSTDEINANWEKVQKSLAALK